MKHKNKKSHEFIITENSVIVSNQNDIGIKFNTAKNWINKIEESNNKFQDLLKNPNERSFYIKAKTPQKVLRILKNLNANKSADIYSLLPKLITIVTEHLKNRIALIPNSSIEQGIFPAELKTIFNFEIHKRKSTFDCSNYRSTTILQILSKIFKN